MTAQQIFESHQKAKANYAAMGMAYHHAFGSMTIEEIQSHLDFCKQVGNELGVNCDPGAMAGKSQDAIRAEMEAKARVHRRGAGARALKNKYGKVGAEAIIQKNTGRKFNLK